MSKKKKKDATIVDMSARLNVKILSTTSDEADILEKDLQEIEIIVEKRMQSYELEIREMILSTMNESIIVASERNSSYFIERYQDMIDRNNKNILKRMQTFQGYLMDSKSIKEQEN